MRNPTISIAALVLLLCSGGSRGQAGVVAGASVFGLSIEELMTGIGFANAGILGDSFGVANIERVEVLMGPNSTSRGRRSEGLPRYCRRQRARLCSRCPTRVDSWTRAGWWNLLS
jgi:hypothetical protein